MRPHEHPLLSRAPSRELSQIKIVAKHLKILASQTQQDNAATQPSNSPASRRSKKTKQAIQIVKSSSLAYLPNIFTSISEPKIQVSNGHLECSTAGNGGQQEKPGKQ
jgi:hypothetical protein